MTTALSWIVWHRLSASAPWLKVAAAPSEREAITLSNELRWDEGDFLTLPEGTEPATKGKGKVEQKGRHNVSREPPVVERGHVVERLRQRRQSD